MGVGQFLFKSFSGREFPWMRIWLSPRGFGGRAATFPGLSSWWVVMIKPALSTGDFHLMRGLSVVVMKYLLLKAKSVDTQIPDS